MHAEADSTKLADWIRSSLGGTAIKCRILSILTQLEPDHWLEADLQRYEAAVRGEDAFFDNLVVLNWYAHEFQPDAYLEVGVRRGRSTAQVAVESPGTRIVGFDMWIPDYASIPEQGIFTTNPGPEFVSSQLTSLGVQNEPKFTVGNSHETLPGYFSAEDHIDQFDLMTVDGDHSYEGAKDDLEMTFEHLAPGGLMVFDDIYHPAHLDLLELWDSYKRVFPDYVFVEDKSGVGTGIAIKPPFTKYEECLGREPH